MLNPLNLRIDSLLLDSDSENLRATVFFSIFGRSIVFDDQESADKYRQYLVSKGQHPPTLYTLDGHRIKSGAARIIYAVRMARIKYTKTLTIIVQTEFGILQKEKDDCRTAWITSLGRSLSRNSTTEMLLLLTVKPSRRSRLS